MINYKPNKPLDNKDKIRLHKGYEKLCQSLAEAHQREHIRPSGLPKDWRNRIFKIVVPLEIGASDNPIDN